jgi:hypothetical protein
MKIKWTGHGTHEAIRKASEMLTGIPARRHRRRWEGNIKMDLKKICCEDIDWIQVVHEGRVVSLSEHDNKPSASIKDVEFLDHLSDYQLLKNSCFA